jgi:hypothetical protein
MESAAILLSRQPLRPSGQSRWIQSAKDAIRWIGQNRLRLYGSIGLSTWETLIVLAQLENVQQTIVLPALDTTDYEQKRQWTIQQFDLSDTTATFLPLWLERERVSKKEFMRQRDRFIAVNADVLIPISIRQDGQMSELVNRRDAERQTLITSFQIPYEARTSQMSYRIDLAALSESVKSVRTGQYVAHWTRASHAAWPSERLIDYYLSVLDAESYPRTAFATLKHILTEKKIIASSRHIPGNIPTVSFSELSPVELIPLIRWRARYCQMSFEPYGIGIEKPLALTLGIRNVRYHQANQEPSQTSPEVWLNQSVGKKSDWRAEKEFRHLGDFDFSTVQPERMICFCYTPDEALEIEKTFGLKTLSFL